MPPLATGLRLLPMLMLMLMLLSSATVHWPLSSPPPPTLAPLPLPLLRLPLLLLLRRCCWPRERSPADIAAAADSAAAAVAAPAATGGWWARATPDAFFGVWFEGGQETVRAARDKGLLVKKCEKARALASRPV